MKQLLVVSDCEVLLRSDPFVRPRFADRVECRLRFFIPFALVISFLLLLACNSKPASTPAAGDPGAGAKVYESACAVCHTTTKEKKVGPGLAGLYHESALPNAEPVNDHNVESWVRNGGGNMPGFKGALTNEQMRDLIAYLKTL